MPCFRANPSRRLRQIAGIADASQHANWCFTGPYGRKRAWRAASSLKRSEKSWLNIVSICELRRRHVRNEMLWEILESKHFMTRTQYYVLISMYIYERVHLRRRITGLQCSKVYRKLSASATTCRHLAVFTLGIYYSIIATLKRCDAMSFWYSYILPITVATRYITVPCQDFRRKILVCPLHRRILLHNFLLLRPNNFIFI